MDLCSAWTSALCQQAFDAPHSASDAPHSASDSFLVLRSPVNPIIWHQAFLPGSPLSSSQVTPPPEPCTRVASIPAALPWREEGPEAAKELEGLINELLDSESSEYSAAYGKKLKECAGGVVALSLGLDAAFGLGLGLGSSCL